MKMHGINCSKPRRKDLCGPSPLEMLMHKGKGSCPGKSKMSYGSKPAGKKRGKKIMKKKK